MCFPDLTVAIFDNDHLRSRSSIQRPLDSSSSSIEHIRIDHGRAHIFVAQQVLHSANIVTVFEKMCSEAMSQGVTTGGLVNFALYALLL